MEELQNTNSEINEHAPYSSRVAPDIAGRDISQVDRERGLADESAPDDNKYKLPFDLRMVDC